MSSSPTDALLARLLCCTIWYLEACKARRSLLGITSGVMSTGLCWQRATRLGLSYSCGQYSARMLLQKDSWAVDYQATKNVLEVAREKGAQHFVLLSAICVQKPLLEFQHAKLKLEAALQSAGDITYSIVRPTAFFKSLAGQVRIAGAAFLGSVSG